MLHHRLKKSFWLVTNAPKKQCTRLNHECDYSPKLAFKDETPKVVDKYLGPNSPLDDWDRTCDTFVIARRLTGLLATAELAAIRDSVPSDDLDDLPPFSVLTSDEEWQRKAEYQRPGTYYVVANSDSFADLEEYRVPYSSPTMRERGRTGHPNISVDEATLILGVFEENPGRPLWQPGTESTRSESTAPTDIILRAGQISGPDLTQTLQNAPTSYPIYTQQDLDFSELNLRFHYRSFVRRHLFRISHDEAIAGVDVEDLFEREAAYCPPVS